MTTCSSRQLRIADCFASLLTGIGLAFVGLRLFVAWVPDGPYISEIHVWLAAIAFVALGRAVACKADEVRAARRQRTETPAG